MSDFKSDLSDSAADFLRVVWPAIQSMVGGGKIIPIESITNDAMTDMLDKYSGIDAWHLSDEKQVRGVASRVQWRYPWDTFTVRYSRDSGAKTEYEKRKADISSGAGWLYPHLTVQAFIAGAKGEKGDLMSVAVIKTKDLIDACSSVLNGGLDPKYCGIRRTGNASFIWTSWDWLKQQGYPIKIARFSTSPHAIASIKTQPAQIIMPHKPAPAYQPPLFA